MKNNAVKTYVMTVAIHVHVLYQNLPTGAVALPQDLFHTYNNEERHFTT